MNRLRTIVQVVQGEIILVVDMGIVGMPTNRSSFIRNVFLLKKKKKRYNCIAIQRECPYRCNMGEFIAI